MHIVLFIGVLILSYIIGSIPFGLVIVRLKTGKDIRKIESGRTGGTNAMRAAGFWAGAATTILDFLKAACAVWIARLVLPGNLWLEVLAPVAAVIGHNYSIFLPDRDENGRFRLRGGAGGASSAGGAFGPSGIVYPICGWLCFCGNNECCNHCSNHLCLASLVRGGSLAIYFLWCLDRNCPDLGVTTEYQAINPR